MGRALRTKRWKYSVCAPDKDCWADAGSESYVEEFLYDLDSDPYELANLIGESAFEEVTADLRALLIAEMVKAGEPAPEIAPAESKQSFQRATSIAEVRERYMAVLAAGELSTKTP